MSVVVLLSLSACKDSNVHIVPAIVSWMEWPAEVAPATTFPVRLRGYDVGCMDMKAFVTTPKADQSAVTFEPYFMFDGPPRLCPTSFAAAFFDTTTTAPGLAAPQPRTYEMRASTSVFTFAGAFPQSQGPVRTFGDIAVGVPATGRTNASGAASSGLATDGCTRLSPPGLYPGYVLENPPDTTHWSGFVRGYLYDATAPVCGETRVFHLVSRN
jgi:hypothetical protein